MAQEAVGYERDIRPLFRPRDVGAMRRFFDLSSYSDVRANADKILERLSGGSMPCDGAWPEEQMELFRGWMAAGCPA
jgi:hypothetical protein